MTKKESIIKVNKKLIKAYESSNIAPQELEVDNDYIKEIYNFVIKITRGYSKTYDIDKLNRQQSILDKLEQDLLHELEMATKRSDMVDISYQLREVRRIRRVCKHNIVKVLFHNEVMCVLGSLNSKNVNKAIKNLQTTIKSEKFPHYTYHIDEEGLTGKNEEKKYEVSSDIVDETKPPSERIIHWKNTYQCKNKEEAKELAIADLTSEGIKVWSKLRVVVK